jgi:hypothetical protein
MNALSYTAGRFKTPFYNLLQTVTPLKSIFPLF